MGDVPLVDARGWLGVQAGFFNTQINIIGAQTWAGQPARVPLAGSPYRGLSAFEADDAELFFGRDEAAGQVLARLAGCAGGPGLVMVSGVSGAGKSSLLRAGVLARLRRDGLDGVPGAAAWPCLLFTPGPEPLQELAVQVAALAGTDPGMAARSLAARPAGFALTARQAALARHGGPPGSQPGRLLLVADQFEQLFTACPDEGQRRAFITALHAAATTPQGPDQVPAALVLLGVRADFEARCADYPELAGAVQDRYLLTAMTGRQLRLAITGPAERAGSKVEAELADVLLREVSARPAGPSGPGGTAGAGVLPLLSHAVDQAWRTRTGDSLTLADYERTGGIEAAVARSAQDAYGQLTPARQAAARQVFTRLAAVGPDGTDTAVPASTATLAASVPEAAPGDVEAVLEAFAVRRLLTLAAGTVEITHEVLLTAWPLLRDSWLAETRADRIIRTGLAGTAAAWAEHDRDPAYLYTGSLLETATAAAARAGADPARHPSLTRGEHAFLAASGRARRRRARRRQGVLAALTALAVALSAITVWAIGQRDTADTERDQVFSARDLAASDALAAQSQTAGNADPGLARLEAVAAWHLAPTPRAGYAMLKAATLPATSILGSGGTPVSSVSFSPDGSTLAAGLVKGFVQLWDVGARKLTATLKAGNGDYITSVAFSPDGSTLAVAGTSEEGVVYSFVQLWDAGARKLTATLKAGPNDIPSVAFSPDGNTLAVGTEDGDSIQLWDVGTRKLTATLPEGGILSVAFSPDGSTLADGLANGLVRLWDVGTRKLTATLPGGNNGSITSVAFSPDGNTLADAAIGGRHSNGFVRLWDVGTRKLTATLPGGNNGSITSVAFSPDGSTLADAVISGGLENGFVQLWNVGTRKLTATLPGGNNGSITSVAFSPDGNILADGSSSGPIQLSDIAAESVISDPLGILPAGNGGFTSVAFSPDGNILAVASTRQAGPASANSFYGFVRLWNVSTHRIAATLPVGNNDSVGPVAFSPDDSTLAVADGDSIQLWDVGTRKLTATLPGGNGGITSVAFSPDGSTLAAGYYGNYGFVRLWDVSTRRIAARLKVGNDGSITSVAFSPDGNTLAVAAGYYGNYGFVRLWDVSTRRIAATLPAYSQDGSPLVAFSPDGKTLAVVNDTPNYASGFVQLWDMTTLQQAATPVFPGTGLLSVMFSPDDSVLAIDTFTGTQLWDVATHQQVSTLPTNPPRTLQYGAGLMAFSPGGTLLAVTTGNGQVQLWNVPTLTDAISSLCTLAGQPFPPAEWSQYAPGVPYQKTCPEHVSAQRQTGKDTLQPAETIGTPAGASF